MVKGTLGQRGWVVACTLGAVLLTAPGARATGASPAHRYRLDWIRSPGAEACPDETALRAAVSSHLVSSALDPAAERRVEATARRDAGRFRVVLRLFDETGALRGSRSLASESPSCGPVFESAAFAIALAIDPDAQLSPRRTEPETASAPNEPQPGGAPAPAPVRAENAATVAAPRERDAWLRLDAVSVAVASSTKVVPDLAFGVTAAGNVSFSLPFEAAAAVHVSPGVSSEPTEGGRVRVGLTVLTLGVVVPWALRRSFRSEAFVGLTGGALTLGVRDAEPIGGSLRSFIGFQAGLGLRALLDDTLGLRASVHALVPFHRYRLLATGYPGVLWEQPEAGLVAEVGPVWVFSE